jgi:signal transduction histidine kinase
VSSKSSVLSSFRLAAVALILGVALIGAVFYGFVNTHFLGLVIERTFGPYSDSLAQVGFSSPDPEVWRKIAMRHEVVLIVEHPGGETEAWNEQGEAIEPDAPALGLMSTAARTGPDGTRVTFLWAAISFRESHLPLLAALLFMVVAVVGATFWLLQRQLKPLVWLRNGVEALGRGEFDSRVPVLRNDEIGQVAQAFNAMTTRVGAMIEDRERLLADVSHELRSPIARMKVALELMEPGERRDGLARDLREMEGLISTLLEREAVRSRSLPLEGDRVDLAEIATQVADAVSEQHPGVELERDGAFAVRGDRELLRLLIHNVVDNALKFSREDSDPVRILLGTEGDFAILRVRDDGIGIPAKETETLFEPFVKRDPARGHYSGYGLGLNICQRIVELHQGTIELRPLTPRGTEVIVRLPNDNSSD